MSGDFVNMIELESFIDKAMSDVIEKIISETEKKVVDIVYEKAYIKTEPLIYDRTWEFANAFVFNRDNIRKHIVELFFDEGELRTQDEMHHEIDSQDLFEILEDGKNKGGNPSIYNEGGFVKDIYEWLGGNFIRMVVDGFKAWGMVLEQR